MASLDNLGFTDSNFIEAYLRQALGRKCEKAIQMEKFGVAYKVTIPKELANTEFSSNIKAWTKNEAPKIENKPSFFVFEEKAASKQEDGYLLLRREGSDQIIMHAIETEDKPGYKSTEAALRGKAF